MSAKSPHIEKITALKARLAWIIRRIECNRGKGVVHVHDHAERTALEWAIPILEKSVASATKKGNGQ